MYAVWNVMFCGLPVYEDIIRGWLEREPLYACRYEEDLPHILIRFVELVGTGDAYKREPPTGQR